LDVGCGTGYALEHVPNFKEYHGFDPDDRAIARFRRTRSQANIRLYARIMTASDMETLRPTKALLMGLLHHLSDDDAIDLLRTLQITGTVQRIVTWDTLFRPGKHLNNVLAMLDRGRYTRYDAGYVQLLKSAGLEIVHQASFCSGNGLALYYATCCAPKEVARDNS
ncbi:MAG: class I SAM-dependent methyltransferase, partial [Thermoguttaceae bacterium]